MDYDLQGFCRDLQERLNWLAGEVARLQVENERLLKQNRMLREETTLARLFRDIGTSPQEEAAPPLPIPASVSREAMEFYHRLPAAFTFAGYFSAAETSNVADETARNFMMLFFRENMLMQMGTQIEKTGHMPYPRRLVPGAEL